MTTGRFKMEALVAIWKKLMSLHFSRHYYTVFAVKYDILL